MRLRHRNDVRHTATQRLLHRIKCRSFDPKLYQSGGDKIPIVVHKRAELAGEYFREFHRACKDHIRVTKNDEYVLAGKEVGGVNEATRAIARSVIIAIAVNAVTWRRIKCASSLRQIMEVGMPVSSRVVNNNDRLMIHPGDAREIEQLALPPGVGIVLGGNDYLVFACHMLRTRLERFCVCGALRINKNWR